MARILFDIAPTQTPDEWMHCHLVIEISRPVFSFAIMGPDKQLAGLRFYALDAHDNQEMGAEILHILEQDSFLKNKTGKETIIYNFAESQLIPEEHFDQTNGGDLSTLLYGDLHTAALLHERIAGSRQYNVYQVPAEIHDTLQQFFSGSRHWHYYSLWMECMQHETVQPDAYLLARFYPNSVLVTAVKDQQLQLMQTYTYAAAEDVAYHLLNICAQLQLAPEFVPVTVSGMIERSSALYTEIHKYFGQLSLESHPVSDHLATEAYPVHFFSPLLKLAACVS